VTYRFEYRQSFWQDYFSTLEYIAVTLKNPIAARALDEAFEREKRVLLSFPRAARAYASPPAVDTEYYAIRVKNYLAFYIVNGETIEFRRFLYSRSELSDRLPFSNTDTR